MLATVFHNSVVRATLNGNRKVIVGLISAATIAGIGFTSYKSSFYKKVKPSQNTTYSDFAFAKTP